MPLVTDESEIVAGQPEDMPPKKHTVRNIILAVVAVVVLGVVGLGIYVGYGLAHWSDSCGKRTVELEEMVKKNVAFLDGLTVIDGQRQKATGAPNGDCLTGTGGPGTVTYDVSGMVSEVNAQVARNLKKRGFEMSEKFNVDGSGNTSVTDVWTTATDGTSTLEIWYKLEKPYLCPETQRACAGPEIIHKADLLEVAARQVTVTLGGVILSHE